MSASLDKVLDKHCNLLYALCTVEYSCRKFKCERSAVHISREVVCSKGFYICNRSGNLCKKAGREVRSEGLACSSSVGSCAKLSCVPQIVHSRSRSCSPLTAHTVGMSFKGICKGRKEHTAKIVCLFASRSHLGSFKAKQVQKLCVICKICIKCGYKSFGSYFLFFKYVFLYCRESICCTGYTATVDTEVIILLFISEQVHNGRRHEPYVIYTCSYLVAFGLYLRLYLRYYRIKVCAYVLSYDLIHKRREIDSSDVSHIVSYTWDYKLPASRYYVV